MRQSKTPVERIEETIKRLEEVDAAYGGAWREGMLRHYRQLLAQMLAAQKKKQRGGL